MKKISLIITVLNEEKTIDSLLKSIKNQELKPTEVIIVDGGSTDTTVEKVKAFAQKNISLNILVKTKKGNRSVGRNYAIELTKNSLLAVTDAGCTLDKKWLSELVKKYESTGAPVVAGYYSADAKTSLQKAIIPYVLVMPDRVDSQKFLPATRSVLLEKKVFQTLGGFDERYSDNEDYVFAKKLVKKNIKIAFTELAIAYWIPVSTIKDFYRMIFRFARGDFYAGIIRPKVTLIFLRYVLLFFVFFLSMLFKQQLNFFIFCSFFLLGYIVWSIKKNARYVGSGWLYLPTLQIVSDIAVIIGSASGFYQRIKNKQ